MLNMPHFKCEHFTESHVNGRKKLIWKKWTEWVRKNRNINHIASSKADTAKSAWEAVNKTDLLNYFCILLNIKWKYFHLKEIVIRETHDTSGHRTIIQNAQHNGTPKGILNLILN